MTILLSDEFRLLYALGLIIIPFGCAWRFVRRWNGDRLEAAGQAFVLFYAIQYLSVCLPALAGLLTPISLAITALIFSVLLLAMAGRSSAPQSTSPRPFDALAWIACLFFVVAYAGAVILHEADLPPLANDALTYHLPAAVQWLTTHRLSLFDCWYFNPANTYSPLAGSTFIAYLIAPMGNDVLARFVEAGALLFLFFAMVSLLRRLGMRLAVASIVAVAAVLARPLVSQIILAKDDLFVAAFFVAFVNAATAHKDETNPLPPLIAGLALGLLIATKYTALYSLPIVLIMIDGPRRRGWHGRNYVVATLIALVLAGGWYARNWVLTGNPLYPMEIGMLGTTLLPGMLHIERSHLLRYAGGVWRVFAHGYYSPLPGIVIVLAVGWLVTLVRAVLSLRSKDAAARSVTPSSPIIEPLWRAVILGPPLVIVLFALTSPYAEARFLYPALMLLFAAFGLAIETLPAPATWVCAGGLALACALTAFPPHRTVPFSVTAVVAGAIACLIAVCWQRRWIPRMAKTAFVLLAALGLAVAVYVHWQAYIEGYRAQTTPAAWSHPGTYDGQAKIWNFVRGQLPRDAKLAYANTYFVYPLLGFNYTHRAVYVPTRKNLRNFLDMSRIPEPVTGEQIPEHIIHLLDTDPDRQQWLSRLRKSRAEYLVVFTIDPERPERALIPPEQTFAEADPRHFERIYPMDHEHVPGAVYRIHWPD